MIDRVKTNTPLPARTKAKGFANILIRILGLIKLSFFFLFLTRVNKIIPFNCLHENYPGKGFSWQQVDRAEPHCLRPNQEEEKLWKVFSETRISSRYKRWAAE